MGNYITELEILQDENFVIKAPKGFKSDVWRSKSGREGKVLYDSFFPDYISSDCYITVSTIAKEPITAEIRRRVEVHIGKEGFDFEFTQIAGKSAVFYWHEEEVDYRTYHAFITLSDRKAVIVEVIFNQPFDNSKQVAWEIVDSIQTNIDPDVTDEELARDTARLEAEAQKEAARQAQMEEEKRLQQESMKEEERERLKRELAKEQEALARAQQEEQEHMTVSQNVQDVQEEAATSPETSEASLEPEVEEDVVPVLEETKADEQEADSEPLQQEAPQKISEEDAEEDSKSDSAVYEDENMQAIYKKIQDNGKTTLNELQSIPALRNMGRMEIKDLLDQMIKHDSIIRFEEDDKIYFATPEFQRQRKQEEQQMQDMSEEDRYKLEYEKYKQAMEEWKKSKDFLGRTNLPKPVPPVKVKKHK